MPNQTKHETANMKARNIRVDEDLWQEFTAKCRAEGEPVSIVMRRLMRAWVREDAPTSRP